MADLTLNPKYVRPLEGSTVIKAKAGANITVGDLVYLNTNNEAVLTDADVVGSLAGNVFLVVASGAYRADGTIKTGEPITLLASGRVSLGATLVNGQQYYVSNTPGKIADAAGTNSRSIGAPESTTGILLFEANK